MNQATSRASATCLAGMVVLLLELGGALPATAGDALPLWLHGEVQVSVGLDYSDGDYGEDEDTQMVYMPFTLAYVFDDFALTPTRRDQLELRVTVPYLHVDGVFTAGIDETSTEDGIGDVRLSVLYVYYPTRTHLPAAELGFHTKLPTASENRGLGTGKVDYGLGLTLFQRVGDFVPFVAGHYRFVGENEPDYDLRDGAAASLGLSFAPLPSWSLGASYDWRQSISRRSTSSGGLVRADDGHELTFYGSLPLGGRLQLSPYAVAGLSQGSPDYAVGFQLKLVIPVRP